MLRFPLANHIVPQGPGFPSFSLLDPYNFSSDSEEVEDEGKGTAQAKTSETLAELTKLPGSFREEIPVVQSPNSEAEGNRSGEETVSRLERAGHHLSEPEVAICRARSGTGLCKDEFATNAINTDASSEGVQKSGSRDLEEETLEMDARGVETAFEIMNQRRFKRLKRGNERKVEKFRTAILTEDSGAGEHRTANDLGAKQLETKGESAYEEELEENEGENFPLPSIPEGTGLKKMLSVFRKCHNNAQQLPDFPNSKENRTESPSLIHSTSTMDANGLCKKGTVLAFSGATNEAKERNNKFERPRSVKREVESSEKIEDEEGRGAIGEEEEDQNKEEEGVERTRKKGEGKEGGEEEEELERWKTEEEGEIFVEAIVNKRGELKVTQDPYFSGSKARSEVASVVSPLRTRSLRKTQAGVGKSVKASQQQQQQQQREVLAGASPSPGWRNSPQGRKEYVNKKGKVLVGRLAYLESLKDKGKR